MRKIPQKHPVQAIYNDLLRAVTTFHILTFGYVCSTVFNCNGNAKNCTPRNLTKNSMTIDHRKIVKQTSYMGLCLKAAAISTYNMKLMSDATIL